MSQNEFTKDNIRTGLSSQVILDAGLNVFALDLLVESFTDLAGRDSQPVQFTYKGVNICLQISDKAI